MSYLSVTNFHKHQHYKNRKPPWIKFYVELLDPHNKINKLSVSTRFLFDRLLLLAAEWDNAVPNDFELLAKLVVMDPRDCREGLDELLKGRWLTERKTKRRASKSASNRASDFAPTEAEAEQEAEQEKEAEAEPPYALPDFTFDEKALEVDRILEFCVDVRDDSRDAVMRRAKPLPLASIVKVRESCRRKPRCGVGYAIEALKSEAKEVAA